MDSPSINSETSESQKSNYNFVQVSRDYMRDLRQLMRKSPHGAEILMYLVEHMGKSHNAVICSYVTLMEVTGLSRASVGRAIKILKDDHWIQSVRVGSASAYAVNANVFWRAHRNQKRYAIFQATVIASESEQQGSISDQPKLRHIPVIGDSHNTRIITNSEDLPPPDQKDLGLD